VRIYEVFLKKPGKDGFAHVGALEAPDPELALLLAREAYVRRGEGVQMWLVDRADVLAADEESLAVNADKPHRHNDGVAVAAHRKQRRESS
jgi:ring-1,2-phenylacetyl-CoA epoxidase subunit PaaB